MNIQEGFYNELPVKQAQKLVASGWNEPNVAPLYYACWTLDFTPHFTQGFA